MSLIKIHFDEASITECRGLPPHARDGLLEFVRDHEGTDPGFIHRDSKGRSFVCVQASPPVRPGDAVIEVVDFMFADDGKAFVLAEFRTRTVPIGDTIREFAS